MGGFIMQQNAQPNVNNKVMMQQPPAIISTKDALYLTDMLSWNLLAMKKAHFFAGQCQDTEIVALINKCGQMHQKHYNQILKHLNNGQPQLNNSGLQ